MSNNNLSIVITVDNLSCQEKHTLLSNTSKALFLIKERIFNEYDCSIKVIVNVPNKRREEFKLY